MSVRRNTRRDPKTGAPRQFWMVDVVFEHADGRRERVRKVSPVTNGIVGPTKSGKQRKVPLSASLEAVDHDVGDAFELADPRPATEGPSASGVGRSARPERLAARREPRGRPGRSVALRDRSLSGRLGSAPWQESALPRPCCKATAS